MPTSTATPAKVVAAALRDLGKPGPTNTCVSNGLQRFARAAGAPLLTRRDGTPTASITEARVLGKAGVNGWTYHEGLDGIQPGDQVDWARPVGIFHVSTVIAVRKLGGHVIALRTIGSGGPTQKINWQPAAGTEPGWNVTAYFRGFWRMPYASTSKVVAKPAKSPRTPPPPAVKVQRRVPARAGDGLAKIAAREKISLDRIKTLNPNVKGPEFRISVGQRIRVQ